jgi:serine/threonine protein kinase
VIFAGKYTLIEMIGEGGMGSVYLAHQTEPVKRSVAHKLIKGGMDSKAVLARFGAERQALAMMDHPNIARVFDGGTTPSGQPFFVMEFVRGVPITRYCDEHRLSPIARLELFVQVCTAVQHAHQTGIIHRDLKPGNVLVTEVDGRPTPKVIDFGVAKATEQRLTDHSFGDTGAIVGTPAYMSPEQADPSSMDIDTRTDVYALGVMLYELLTGSTPIDAKEFRRGAVLEMLRMVREVEPPRPSTRLSTAQAMPSIAACRDIEPRQLVNWVRGDIDWIVMKGLEEVRDRCYATANGFAADIQRFLANKPVVARPPSRGYRLRKFVRRNRGTVVAASLVLVALVADFPAVPQYCRRLAHSLVSLGNAQRAREDWAEAERHYRDALVIQKKLVDDFPETSSYRSDQADSHWGLAFTLKRAGRPAESEIECRNALDRKEKLAAEFSAEHEFRHEAANLGRELGVLLYDRGRDQAGAKLFPKAIDTLEQLVAEFPSMPIYRSDLSRCRRDFGKVLGYLKKPVDAENQFHKAVAHEEKLVADNPTVLPYQADLGLSYSYFANLLRDGDTPADSLEWYGKAIRTLTAAYERDRQVILTKTALYKCHEDRARALNLLGKHVERSQSGTGRSSLLRRTGC